MKKIGIRVTALAVVLAFLILLSPGVSVFAGTLQERIQSRIKAPKNMQYNLDVGEQYSVTGQSAIAPQQPRDGRTDSKRPASDEARVLKEESTTAPILSSYAVYKTDYQAEIEEDIATVEGSILFEVFKKGWTKIPLVRSSVGLIDVSINKGASFVVAEGNKYYLMVDKPGRYNLEIEFLIKASREREGGPGSFNFETIPAPISQFEFTMPESGVEIFVEPAIRVEQKAEGKKTVAWAVMPNTNSITVRWTKALPKETITPVKLEPKVYAETATYAAVGEGFIRCQTSLSYSILQTEISNLRIVLPEDISVLEVNGRNLRDWKASSKDGQQYLDVYFNFGVKGNYVINLSYERKIGEGSVVAEIPWVKAAGVEREKGYVGLAASTNVELAVNKTEHVTPIDVKELPSSIWGSTANPILLAFKYSTQPFAIAIDVTRHEELPVLVAAIDSADYISLVTDEGKNLTKAIYQVRNNVKQFVRLILPKKATIWSVFVSGKPVKPAKDKTGSILIPLEKSRMSDSGLNQFPVEIVYLDDVSKMSLLGNLRLNLPKSDIPISSLNWSVYLPIDFTYFNFGGDVKPAQRAAVRIASRSISGKLGGERPLEKKSGHIYDRESQFSQQQAQVFYDEVQSAKMKGVLPIRIDIPREGRLYNFSKLLVTEKESPWLSVSFITVFKKLHKLFWLVVLIFVLVKVSKRIFKKKA
ncbi:MAG: hypothetical protein V1674_03025 [Candidatus Omnitrophota bacterium]